MKTASLLFGLAACASSPASKPQYPLCDGEGAPACGNIGQVGRASAPATPASTRSAPTVATTLVAPIADGAQVAARLVPVATRVLIQASSGYSNGVSVFSGPLMNRNAEVVCGNVMSKGGSRRVCRTPDGNVVSSKNLDAESYEGLEIEGEDY